MPGVRFLREERVVRRLLLLTVMALVSTGCGAMNTMTEGFQHSQEVANDLGGAVGSKPFVGFNWNNGSLTNVTITFDGIPPGKTNEELAALSRSAIRARFKQEPQNIVLGFRIAGQGQ
jgi:hypothetical protein